MDSQVQGIEVKIKQCDEELLKYKQQMSKGGAAAAGVRQRALTVLKRKKMYEAQRNQMLNTQFNVDQAQFATEQIQTTLVTLDAMKAANVHMKQQMQQVKIDDVENMMDDMEDLMMDQNEISELLGRNYALPDGFDESELEAEFAQLEEECALDAVQGITASPAVPSYLPSAVPVTLGPAASAPPQAGQNAMPASAPPMRMGTPNDNNMMF